MTRDPVDSKLTSDLKGGANRPSEVKSAAGLPREAKYMYCIIGPSETKNFGPMGIGARGDELFTVTYRNLSAVVSDSPIEEYRVNRENTMAHEQAIERVMKEHPILPIRFSTIAESEEEIVEKVLKPRYQEFQELLDWISDKKELGLKVYWLDMKALLNEIVEENEGIRSFKEAIQKKSPGQTYYDQIDIGKLIENALNEKRENEKESLVKPLKRMAEDWKVHTTYLPELILHAAFLVLKTKEDEFNMAVDQIDRDHPGRYRIHYVTDAPPVNFVNIVIHWDQDVEGVKNVHSR